MKLYTEEQIKSIYSVGIIDGKCGADINNIDYLILVAPVTKKNGGGKSMIVLRKYQPVTVTLNPLFCVATPINKFPTPKGLGFIDHESIVHKTENLNGI